MTWTKYITYPSVNLILGFRGMGKSALAFRLLEICGAEYNVKKVVFGLSSRDVNNQLPDDYIVRNDISNLPSDSVILVDEISLHAYAREAMSTTNKLFDKLTALSRKQNQIIFYVTHHSRKIDVNIVTDIDNLIFKKPSKLHIEMDRPAIKVFSKRAYAALMEKGKKFASDNNISDVSDDRVINYLKKWSYILNFNRDTELLMKNDLPGYWSDDLSNLIPVDIEEDNKSTYEGDKINEKYINETNKLMREIISDLSRGIVSHRIGRSEIDLDEYTIEKLEKSLSLIGRHLDEIKDF